MRVFVPDPELTVRQRPDRPVTRRNDVPIEFDVAAMRVRGKRREERREAA